MRLSLALAHCDRKLVVTGPAGSARLPHTGAILAGSATGSLVDLRVVLAIDRFIMRLVLHVRKAGAIVVPPQLAVDRVAVFIDDDARFVAAPGGPQQRPVGIENAQLDEGAAESDSAGEVVRSEER